VHSRHDDRSEIGLHRNTAIATDAELAAEQRLSRDGAEADEHFRL
jgi:hypothetical protein